jgi:hypothetical protein
VRCTKGEDCLTCAVISGADGQFEVSFAQDGRTIIDIRSYDDRSRDAQGNAVGASLVKAIGSTSAQCDAGMDTTCASPSLKGLSYILADDDRCPITAKEKQPTEIPACARIAGFQIQANESTAQPETNPRTGKILLGTHIGDATIVSLAGVDTGQAVVKFERKLDDVVEDCARNIGANEDGTVPSEKVANCVKSGLSEWGKKVLTRRAVCPRSTLYMEFGNYSLIDYVKEEDQKKDDHTWRPVRTNWKNHRDDKIVGNCGGCNTPQLLDTYRILCPSWYRDALDGRDPY